MAQRIVDIGIGSQAVQNDFDGLPIYKEMKRVTDEFGNVFVRVPKFYIRKTNTAGKLAIQISKEELSGGYLPKCFWDFTNNKELPHVDVGAYLASLNGDKLESKSGKTPLVTRTIAQFRTYATNNGVGYQQMDIHTIDMLQCLFYVEFATLHSQIIHPGYTGGTGAKLTGGTDSVVASSGAVANNALSQFKYRGIEDLWGNVYQFVDGLNIRDHRAWVCEDATQYASGVYAAPYKQIGYTNATDNGYVKEMGYDPNYPYAQFPIQVGAGTTTYYADYYNKEAGDRLALFGGAWSNGVNAGLSAWYLHSSVTNASALIGGRLLKKAL